MVKKAIPVVLNLFTLIGGHIYNKRYDRVLVFCTLMTLWYIGSWFLSLQLINTVSGHSWQSSVPDSLNYYIQIQWAGMLVLFVASAATAYVDTRNTQQQLTAITRWITLVCGVLLSGYLVFVFLSATFSLLSLGKLPGNKGASGSSKSSSASSDFWFSTDNFFLNGISFRDYSPLLRDETLPDPPTGPASITGEFHLDGKPVPGITFDMVIDNKFRAKGVNTNDKGLFSIPVQPGKWHIDYVHIRKWNNKPEGRKLFLVSGREAKLRGNYYNEHNYFEFNQGLPVEASADSQQQSQITIEIRDKLQLLTPDENARSQEILTNDYTVQWQAYPQAKHYLVKFSEITRKGSTTSYHPVANIKVTDRTELPLSELKTVAEEDGPFEYQVEVFAFDSNNNFLSKSESFSNRPTLLLKDGKKIVDDDASKMFGTGTSFEEKDFEEIRNNTKRLDAAKILIQEKMFEAARALLTRVKGKTEPGKKDAITGYLLAEQNQCEEAKKYFEQARKDNPEICIPKCYSKNCK